MVGLNNSSVQTGFTFGQAAAPQTGVVSPFTLQANPTSTAVVSPFGLSTTASTPGFSFQSNVSTQQATTGLGTGLFSVPQTTASATFGFTTSSTTATVPFPATSTSTSGFGLGGAPGSHAGSSTGLGLGLFTAPSTSAGGFSISSTSTGQTGTGLGQFTFPSTPSTTTFSGLTLPIKSTATSTAGTGINLLSFPQSSAASSGAGLSLSSGIPSSLTTAASTGFSLGLGGTSATTTAALGSFQAKTEGQSVKEVALPQDMVCSVSEFESYKNGEKKACEENVRQTAAPFHKLGDDTKRLRQHVNILTNQQQQIHTSARKMKASVVEQASNVEMAIRTQSTSPNLQGDNKAPEVFFLNLVKTFEEKITFCRNKIEEVDNCSKANQLKEITPEDLKNALGKEHEIMKLLAARIYNMHSELGDLYEKANKPNVAKPEMLFRPTIGEESVRISPKASTILRPCFSDVSGLLDFQIGQQRAKSISLGNTAPPTLPLNQTSTSSLYFGGSPLLNANQSTLFKPSTYGQNTLFPTLGSNFGQNQSLFGGNVTTAGFGALQPFGKMEQDDATKKRRV